MTVTDLMRPAVVTASRDTPINEVAVRMRDEDVGSVVVVADGAPVGIVTDRDVAVRIVADQLDPAAMPAENAMTEAPATVEADTGVRELIAAMGEASVRRMPVVEGGDLVGIVTLDDLSVLLAEELGTLAEVIEAESPAY